MDPQNPVVQRCVAGMQAEAEDRPETARQLFQQAWDLRQDDFEACIAAHYLARHQATPADTLAWNQAALDFALAVGDERVRLWFASLYLNLGWSHEQLGQPSEAAHFYALAVAHSADLPNDGYGSVVRSALGAKSAQAGEPG
jgi:hypothetical protein